METVDKGLLRRYGCTAKGWTPLVRKDELFDDYECKSHENKSTSRFVMNLAKNWMIVIATERNGSQMTYHFTSLKQCLKEFKNCEYKSEKVYWAFYKAEMITNKGMNDYQTLSDVIEYLMKIDYIETLKAKQKEPERKPISKVGQLPGQLDLWDCLSEV